MSTDSTTNLKRCSKKENCTHPEQTNDGWLPATIEYFCNDKKTKDGFRCYCRYCHRKVGNEWTNNNPEKSRSVSKKSYEKNKEKNQRRSLNYYHDNKQDRLGYNRVYRQENTPKETNRNKKYRRTHPEITANKSRNRRARKNGNGGSHTVDDIINQLKSQKHRCYWCNKNLQTRKYHVDHVIPLSKGGKNDPSNIVISCPICNLTKGDKTLEQWISATQDENLSKNIKRRIEERRFKNYLHMEYPTVLGEEDRSISAYSYCAPVESVHDADSILPENRLSPSNLTDAVPDNSTRSESNNLSKPFA